MKTHADKTSGQTIGQTIGKTGQSNRPPEGTVLAVHGGAGVREGEDYSRQTAHLTTVLEEGGAALAAGAAALDVVCAAVASMEDSGLYVAGRGASASSNGEVELDAAVMDGAGRSAGAVAAVCNMANPVTAARLVMEKSGHVMLVGKGAEAFLLECNMTPVSDPDSYYTPAVRKERMAELAHGTVGAVACDRTGGMAAATSTGGTFGKRAGRVGDSPLIGAGTWADEQVAVSCTGIGEFFIRAAAAHRLAVLRETGAALEEAAHRVIHEDVAGLGGDGGLIAVDRTGAVAMPFTGYGMKRGWITPGSPARVALT